MSKNVSNIKNMVDMEFIREVDGVPVVDAKHELPLIVAQEDIEKAVRKDFDHCVFANTCRRQFNSPRAFIRKTVAYVQHADESGESAFHRYVVPPKARELIERFDAGYDVKQGTMFYLQPPKGLMTLDAMYKKNSNRKAYLNGTMSSKEREKYEEHSAKMKKAAASRKKGGAKYIEDPRAMNIEVRNGSGQFQFTKVK